MDNRVGIITWDAANYIIIIQVEGQLHGFLVDVVLSIARYSVYSLRWEEQGYTKITKMVGLTTTIVVDHFIGSQTSKLARAPLNKVSGYQIASIR